MVYFDQTDPVEVRVELTSNILLVTNHGEDTSYPNLKFSVRRWYERNGILNPGKGITLQEEEAWDLALGIVLAAKRAKIPMVAEVRTKILSALALPD